MYTHKQFLKYLLVGGVVVVVNLTSLYVLTEFGHIYYLLSTVGAFLVAFSVSFVLQKFWTFEDVSRDHLHRQLPLYLLLQLANVSLNTSLMYMFVEYLHVWYLLSQAIISLILAVGIFFINKKYIFSAGEPAV